MRVKTILVHAALFLSCAVPDLCFSETDKLKLKDAYRLALAQSETMQQREQNIRIAEAQYRQAVALLLPQIALNTTQRFRSNDSFGLTGGGGGGSVNDGSDDDESTTVRSASRSRHQLESFVSVKQPIFKGFRDILIAESTEQEINAVTLDKVRAEETLFLDVADVFNQVLLYESDLLILKRVDEIITERITELEKFIKLGRSRESEVLSAQSERADVRATTDRTKGLLSASRELMAFLIGRSSGEFTLEQDSSLTIPLDESHYLARASQRADLRAAEQRRNAAQKQLTATEREHWPALSFEGNAYAYDDPDLNRDWDVLFRLDLPIFEGGAIEARVAERAAQLKIRELSAQEVRRAAEREVRIAYSNYSALAAEVRSLRSLFDATVKSYESQRKEYDLGVVTNLDVLQAIRDGQNARRRLLDAETGMRVSVARLEVAAGGIHDITS